MTASCLSFPSFWRVIRTTPPSISAGRSKPYSLAVTVTLVGGTTGTVVDVVGRVALHHHPTDLLAHHHDLVDGQAAPVAGAGAGGAAHRPVQRRRPLGLEEGGGPAGLGEFAVGRLILLPAAVAQLASQPLGHDAVEGADDQERLDAHLHQPHGGRGGVVA